MIVPVAVIKTEKKQDTFRGKGHLGIKYEKAGDAAKGTEKESMVKLLNRYILPKAKDRVGQGWKGKVLRSMLLRCTIDSLGC